MDQSQKQQSFVRDYDTQRGDEENAASVRPQEMEERVCDVNGRHQIHRHKMLHVLDFDGLKWTCGEGFMRSLSFLLFGKYPA
jgi:hypothetical protein